jgi:hypothetical protein
MADAAPVGVVDGGERRMAAVGRAGRPFARHGRVQAVDAATSAACSDDSARSARATLCPAPASSMASGAPAQRAPTTITSYMDALARGPGDG